MANALKKGRFYTKIPVLILIIAFDLIMIAVFEFISFSYEINGKKLEIDKKLYSGAVMAGDILNGEIKGKENNLKEICRQNGLSYLYSLVKIDNRLFFTGFGSSVNMNNIPVFFQPFNEATELNRKAFDLKVPVFEETTNRFGLVRSVYYPGINKNGSRYLITASIGIESFNSFYRIGVLKTVLSAAFFIILVLPFFVVYQLFIRKDKKELIKHLYTDNLTLLPNRQKLLEDISHSGYPVLMLANIDNFKEINDFYGNDAGDFLLISLANRIKILLSDSGWNVYKMQADEFAVFIDKGLPIGDIENFVEYLWNGISEKPFYYGGNQMLITVAIGVSRAGTDKNTGNDRDERSLAGKYPQSLKKWVNIPVHADMALKKAKKTQKHYIIYHDSLAITKEYENNILWTRKLREAVKEDRMFPYFQPIVNNKTGRIEKYECLMRMKDEEGKIITPDKFLEVSKKSRFYHQITRLIIEKSLIMFENNKFEFSINLAILDILDDETNRFIIKKLKEHKNAAARLVFEILESEGIENYKEVREFIDKLKEYGCKFAIDDFGSGYSNFTHIMKLHVDYIKIDASIIENIDKDYYSQIIAKNITNVAKELGLKTIAEYVRSKEILGKVIELGMDYSQGYYFGKPGPNIEAAEINDKN